VVSKVSIGFQKEWKLKEAQDVENGDVRGFYRELVYKFPSFQEYKLPGNPTAASSSTSMRIPGNVETSKPENEKTQGEVETTNKPQKELGNVAETMETSRKPVETSVSPVPDIDQATIAQDIREILTEAKKAGLIVNDAQQLAQAVAIKVKQRHKGTTMLIANIEHDFYKLAENDHIIQGLIADITGGK
jgi:predicted nucleic acid-binding protein